AAAAATGGLRLLLLELREALLLFLVEGREVHHLGGDLQIGALGGQRADDVGASVGGGDHQRRFAFDLFLRVDVGAVREQCLDGIGGPRLRREHQRGGAV